MTMYTILRRVFRLQFPVIVFVGAAAVAATVRAEDMEQLFRRFNAAYDAGRHSDAERVAQQMLRQSTTEGWQAASLNSLGRVCRELDKNADAEQFYVRALKIRLQPDNVNLGWIPNNLGLVYLDLERYDDAETQFQRALKFFEGLKGNQSSEVASVLGNLGAVRHDRGQYAEAEPYHKRALAIREQIYGAVHKEVSVSLQKLGDIYRHLKRFDDAEFYLKRALAMKEQVLGPEHLDVGKSLEYLATTYRDQKKYVDAEPVQRRALQIREKRYGANDDRLVETLKELALDVELRGRSEEAESLRERAKTIEAQAKAPKTQRVEITVERANVMLGSKVIATVPKGRQFDVKTVNGVWYSIDVVVGGATKTGWVLNTDMTLVTDAVSTAATALVWQEFAPPGGGFSLTFPGPSKATGQTVGGIEVRVYTCDTADATYIAGFMNIPPGKSLTFDAAVASAVAQVKGKLLSQKNIKHEQYPGCECAIQMPNGNVTRQRFIVVRQRWYQVGIDAPARMVNGDDANKFFSSFKLKN